VGIGSVQAGDGSVVSIYVEVRYDKQNGTLNYLRHRYTTLGTDLIDVILVNWHEGMPTVLGAELDLTTVLIIVIGGAIGVIIAFIVLQAYKNKKPIVQKLGE
jgi:predicted amino acid dehydrogenase